MYLLWGGRERERKGENHQCVREALISCLSEALTGDLPHNPGMFPDWESNLRPFSSEAGVESTATHQPGTHF